MSRPALHLSLKDRLNYPLLVGLHWQPATTCAKASWHMPAQKYLSPHQRLERLPSGERGHGAYEAARNVWVKCGFGVWPTESLSAILTRPSGP